MSGRRAVIVVLMLLTTGVIAAAYVSEAQDGLDRVALLLGAGLVALLAWVARLARGVWRDRRSDVVASLVTFGGIAIGGAWAAVDVVRRIQSDLVPFGSPRIHLMVPAVITVCAAGVVVLLGGSMRTDAHADDAQLSPSSGDTDPPSLT